MKAYVICLLIPVLGICAPMTTASARTGNKAQAKTIFDKGELHYQQGEFKQALSLYKKAHKTYPHPAFIFNIAQCHRQLKHYSQALFSYRLFLSEQPNTSNKDEVKRRIREMSQQLAAQRVSNQQKGKLSIITTPAGASIYVNRVKGVPTATSPALLPLSAGQYLIMIKRAGYKTLTKAVDIATRKVTLVKITLERESGTVTPPPDRRVVTPPPDRRVVNPPPARRGVTPTPGTDDPRSSGPTPFYKRWWFWTGIGVAVAAFTVAGVAGSTALSMNDEWDKELGLVDNPDGFKRRGETLGVVADVMFGVGAAAAIGVTVGAILVSLKRKKERQPTTRILPGCGASGCGVWVSGRF